MCREYVYSLKFTEIHLAVSLIVPYELLAFNEIILIHALFSSPPPSSFQTFVGLCDLPREYTLFEHTFVCLIIPLLNQVRAGHGARLVSRNHFYADMYVCVSVCPPPRLLKTIHVK